MGDEGLLRIWSVRPDANTSLLDARIRDEVMPAAADADGLRAFFAARRGTDLEPERVLASVWRDEDALEAARRRGGLVALERALDGEQEEDVLPILFSVASESPAGGVEPAILRIFRGRTRAGEIAAYVDAARRGTAEDIAAGTGPLALYLAAGGDDAFVTLSTWIAWAPIEVATGGNVSRPIATRHTDHLVGGTAAHYEIIPSASPVTRPLRVAAD